MKECRKCLISKDIDSFYKNKNLKDGLQNFCKLCSSNLAKEYRKNNKDRITQQNKRRYLRNKEKCKIHNKEYRLKNKEKLNNYNKKYQKDNALKINERKRELYNENIEFKRMKQRKKYKENIEYKIRKNAYNQNRRKLIRDSGLVISPEEIMKLYYQQDGICFYCTTKLDEFTFTIDHYIPLSKGGLHQIENIRISCKNCNCIKYNKMPEEFYKYIGKHDYIKELESTLPPERVEGARKDSASFQSTPNFSPEITEVFKDIVINLK